MERDGGRQRHVECKGRRYAARDGLSNRKEMAAGGARAQQLCSVLSESISAVSVHRS